MQNPAYPVILGPDASQIVDVADVVAAKTMRVELDMFSGRPNFTWEFSAAERAELIHRLATLPEARQGQFPSRLGYRGVKVTDTNDERTFGEIEVGSGTVILRGAAGIQRTFADPDCAFERWLLETGRGRVPEDLREMAGRQLEDSCRAHK
ncbi:hypothetical protein [Bradyrhizobium sp. 8-10B]|uniref:hypothetical protein n=1 Tax=Bradyrhizobium sp. 8-10B TaxID=3344579 RepID=UPI0035BEBC9A